MPNDDPHAPRTLDEASLRLLLEETPVVLVDDRGKILWHRPAKSEGLGYEPYSRIGTSFFDVVHPKTQDAFRSILETAAKSGRAAAELQLIHANGETRVFEGVARRVGPDRILLTGRDVTDHRVATIAATRSNELLAAVADV